MAEHTITEFVDELDSLDSDGIFAWLAESRSIQAQLEAAVLRAYQRLDRSGAALLDGARSTASWVEHRTGVPAQTVRERLKVGRFLDAVPVIEKHFNAGDIHYSHVRALATIHNPRTAAAMAADEQFFVDQAKQLTVRDYITLSRFWLARVDVDGAERSANELWQSRRAWIAETLDGTIEVSATFDPENGAVFRNVVDAVTQELWEADQGAARAAGPEILRSRNQLVADALVEIARRASQPSAKQNRPLVHLVIDAATLQGRLGNIAITPETATRLDNLAPLCAHHHRLLHEGGYTCHHTNNQTNLTINQPNGHPIGHTPMNPRLTPPRPVARAEVAAYEHV